MKKLNPTKAPKRPGVYFFNDSKGKALYIGKATNLRNRLRLYFRKSATLEPAKEAMLKKVSAVRWRVLASEIEALIEEAKLIKKYRPPYNVLLRDDKNYFYVGFAKEDFPRVFLTHQPTTRTGADFTRTNAEKKFLRPSAYGQRLSATYVGPFTDGKAIKRVMKLLRRIFPYATHGGIPKHCLAYDLGLCPIPKEKDSWVEDAAFRKQYQKSIRSIQAVLRGERTILVKRLKREMTAAAKNEDFERAAKIRDEIAGLESIFRHKKVLEIRDSTHSTNAQGRPEPSRRTRFEINAKVLRQNLSSTLLRYLPQHWPWRIEGYDISNIQGTSATGSLVTFAGTKPDKSGYKKFRIKTVHEANDVAMLKEVIERRLGHSEWPLPDVMLIDGGKAQLNAALSALARKQVSKIARKRAREIAKQQVGEGAYSLTRFLAPSLVIALAKRREELYIPGRKNPVRLPKNHPFLLLMMHVRDEAHRFARKYYLKRHERALFER